MHLQHQYVNHKHSRVRLWPTQNTTLAFRYPKSQYGGRKPELVSSYNFQTATTSDTIPKHTPTFSRSASTMVAPSQLHSACSYRPAIVRAPTCMEVQPQANSQVESADRETRSFLL